MRRLLPIPGPWLLVLALLGMVLGLLAVPASAVDAPGPHPRIAGWTAGPVASSTGSVLSPNEAVALALPRSIAERITGPTALFYFSPTCPHCQDVMPEVNALARHGGLAWLGIATSRSTEDELAAFAKEYEAAFPLIPDPDGAFARSVGARSTPIVLLARPASEGTPEPLNPALVPDPVAVEIFEAYTPFTRGMGSLLLLRSHPQDPFRDFPTWQHGWQGDLVCSSCHAEEARSWALSHHAVAYRTLYMRERAQDLQCVGCHVTGMDKPGAFVVGDHRSPFTDVTCESCHGPGGPHDGQRTDARGTCEGCHDAEHSIAFSVDKGLPLIDHFRSVSMTDAQMLARLEALGSGEAEKALLAFPDGPTVGAATCKSCHKDQHRWWKKDPHSAAMGSLSPTEQQQVECVQCHATPPRFGAEPGEALVTTATDVSSFHTEEGVGCESCHGPGGAHAAAPTRANIVGLGESCPECVIEAICTSCHTPKWDPNWELKPRLQAIQH